MNLKGTNNVSNIGINTNHSNLITNIKNNANNIRKNKQNDINYLLIEELNNSVDNKKMRNNNMLDLYSNNIVISKENKKKSNDKNYVSNTLNIKKNKNKLNDNKIMVDSVFGKILKVNDIQKSRDKKENSIIREKNEKPDVKKKIYNDLNNKDFTTRNTYFEGDSKIFEKQKAKMDKERKVGIEQQKKVVAFNPKNKINNLDSYNRHKSTISSDITNHHIQIDISAKESGIKKFENIRIFDNNKGNKSLRQNLYDQANKNIERYKINYTEENLKKKSSSINKDKKVSYNNRFNSDFQDYILKTEENEIFNTNAERSSLEPNLNSKHKFKMNINLNKLESKFLSKDDNNNISELNKRLKTGIYSSNNLKYFKMKNGIYKKIDDKAKINDERINSNRKRSYKSKFTNLSGASNMHNSENKIKKYNKIYIQKKPNDIITNSFSSKLNNFNYKSNIVNYNNITNSNERKNTNPKNKSIKNYEKDLNFTCKYPLYYIEEGMSSFDYDIKNNSKKNNNLNMNEVHSIKNNYQHQTNYIRQIKKNDNYIHIRRKQLLNPNNKRNQSKYTNSKKENMGTNEPLNSKDLKNSSKINTMRSPFHQVNKTEIINDNIYNLSNINKRKINITSNNNNCDENNNPLVNIRNTFISFNMYPKYYVDPKKKLSSPKIDTYSPKSKYQNVNTNLKMYSNKKIISSSNNNHLRKNTLPQLESPNKRYKINNFMNIQKNIFNNIDNKKFYYYTNTEYNENINISRNINLDNANNMKKKLLNEKSKANHKEISSSNKKNFKMSNTQNTNINNKNLCNTLSPNNNRKFYHKLNLNNKTYSNYDEYFLKNDEAKKNNYLSNFETNYENEKDKKKREMNILENSHNFNYMKKNNIINAIGRTNCNSTINEDISSKYRINFKINNKHNFNINN